MVVLCWSEAGLPVEEVITRREVRAHAALLVKHFDEMVSFGRLGMSIFVQNTLVYSISGLREANELADLFEVWKEEVIGQAFHLVHLPEDVNPALGKIDWLLQRHCCASDDQYFLERIAFHSFIEIVSSELGQSRLNPLQA